MLLRRTSSCCGHRKPPYVGGQLGLTNFVVPGSNLERPPGNPRGTKVVVTILEGIWAVLGVGVILLLNRRSRRMETLTDSFRMSLPTSAPTRFVGKAGTRICD